MAANLRVLLVDDHAVVREGFRALVDAQPDMEVVGEAGDGISAPADGRNAPARRGRHGFRHARAGRGTGNQAAQRGLPGRPGAGTDGPRGAGILQAVLRAGASGYGSKQSPAGELFHAIRVVASGGIYLDPAFAGKVVGKLVGKDSMTACAPRVTA